MLIYTHKPPLPIAGENADANFFARIESHEPHRRVHSMHHRAFHAPYKSIASMRFMGEKTSSHFLLRFVRFRKSGLNEKTTL